MESAKKQLKKLIKQEQKPLSDVDMRNLMDGHCNVVLYSDLHNMNSIDEVLGPYNCCMLLWQWVPGYGHWCCLSKHGDEVEYFDPYGYPCWHWIDHIPEGFREESHQDYSYLGDLLVESPYELSYNQYDFQGKGRGISTCGRWSVARGLLKDMSLDEFKDLFLSIYGDKLVTILTS